MTWCPLGMPSAKAPQAARAPGATARLFRSEPTVEGAGALWTRSRSGSPRRSLPWRACGPGFFPPPGTCRSPRRPEALGAVLMYGRSPSVPWSKRALARLRGSTTLAAPRPCPALLLRARMIPAARHPRWTRDLRHQARSLRRAGPRKEAVSPRTTLGAHLRPVGQTSLKVQGTVPRLRQAGPRALPVPGLPTRQWKRLRMAQRDPRQTDRTHPPPHFETEPCGPRSRTCPAQEAHRSSRIHLEIALLDWPVQTELNLVGAMLDPAMK
mmetsp:Transcript_88618/g.251207  ORF Transcript_88618/g.251207 Transcript_88618/m.251207 type:complete len:268 (-) Transcript_88618:477-1280(-)